MTGRVIIWSLEVWIASNVSIVFLCDRTGDLGLSTHIELGFRSTQSGQSKILTWIDLREIVTQSRVGYVRIVSLDTADSGHFKIKLDSLEMQ